MNETLLTKIERQDIEAPLMESGGTAIVLQRHERYEKDRSAENAGSITESKETFAGDVHFFEEMLKQETDGAETMILFISSPAQYAGKGRRSMETAQLAQDAAVKVLSDHDIDPSTRIINLNPDFSVSRFDETNQDIRPDRGIIDPQMFKDSPDFVRFLRSKYDAEGLPGLAINQPAFAAYEADADAEVREEMGAEGVYDILDRTKKSLSVMERYASIFHTSNPNRRLVIWATSHYDTISPLVKDATDTSFEEYVPVDYGGGVVLNIPPSGETMLTTHSAEIAIKLGKKAVNA